MENNQPSFFTLKSRNDYLTLKKSGKRIFTDIGLIFNYKPNNLNHTRFGWTLPRYVGNAVVRNRLKRYCRECSRLSLGEINSLKLDVNIVFLKKGKDHYKNIKFVEIENAIVEFIRKYNKRYQS